MPSLLADATTDWITAVGTVVAALGTVAAVSVALIQSARQSKTNLRVECKYLIEQVGAGRRARQRLLLVATNRGPRSVRINEALLSFRSGNGAFIGQMTAGGDELSKLLGPEDQVTAEWDFAAVEAARVESDGEPFTHLSFVDAYGREHSAPFPGMKRKWQWRRLRREFVPIRPREGDRVRWSPYESLVGQLRRRHDGS